MTARMDVAAAKLVRKVKAARGKYVEMVRSASTLDEYVKGVADFTGLPEGTVRASLPVQNYSEFQKNAEAYVDVLISKVTRAVETGKWQRGYRMAFGGR